jgi:hypothetical protein
MNSTLLMTLEVAAAPPQKIGAVHTGPSLLAVATGDRKPGGPIYTIDEIL